MDAATAAKLTEANNVADAFVKLYFETVDKNRFLLSKLYMDTGTLVWNGNAIAGNNNIQEFFFKMPRTIHTVDIYHAQPIMVPTGDNAPNVLIQASGLLKFPKKIPTPYTQNFVLCCQSGKWKIANACFRLHHPVDIPIPDSLDAD